MIYFLEAKTDRPSIAEYLEGWGRRLADRIETLHYEDLPEQRSLPAGAYIFGDLDALTPAGRRVAENVWSQLKNAGARVLNSPATTCLRLGLLEELHRRGLNGFRAVRASGDFRGLTFPVFLREEHRHGGGMTPQLRTPAEAEAALAWAVATGHSLDDLLVVEFCDTSDADGFFRKYGAFRVGDEIIPRNLAYGRDWMLKHAGTKFSEPMVREERDYVFENPHERQLRRIFEAAGVEYGRIDYAVKDGTVQTWEINLTPTIGRPPNFARSSVPKEFRAMRNETKERFYRRFEAALEALDVDGRALPPVTIVQSAGTVRYRGPLTRVTKRSRWENVLRGGLRPLKPVLRVIVEAISPLLLERARRRSGAALRPDGAGRRRDVSRSSAAPRT